LTAHALTIDLEDWHQLVARKLTGVLGPPSRSVVTSTHRLLDLLDEVKVRATFFVLGLTAEAYPELVRDVSQRGHEVGSHTHAHELVYRMEPAAFRADLGRSVKSLQDLTGQPVLGFRAPEFSVARLGHWCFEVMAEMGLRYDSSVFPLSGPRYGIPDAPRHPFDITTKSGTIREFPLATWGAGRRRWPVAGGTYFRILPSALLRRAFREIDGEGRAAILYFHPYEFSDEFLTARGVPWRRRLSSANLRFTIQYNFLTGSIARRLRPLLTSLTFRTLGEIYRDDQQRA
jgi:polysaccharide deacetylase family protein (PEP-CTERM system associated)